jgi:hypothetical protein
MSSISSTSGNTKVYVELLRHLQEHQTLTRDNIEFYVKTHLPPDDTQVQDFRVPSLDPQDVKLHNFSDCSIHSVKNGKYRGLSDKRDLKDSDEISGEWTDTSDTPSVTDDEEDDPPYSSGQTRKKPKDLSVVKVKKGRVGVCMLCTNVSD